MTLDGIKAVVALCDFNDWKLQVRLDDNVRPYLQVVATTPCNVTGEPMTWSSRKWMLSHHMTRSEIVQTAFKAVMTCMEHEVREQFTYRGRPIFGPHFDVDRLVKLCDSGGTDERPA